VAARDAVTRRWMSTSWRFEITGEYPEHRPGRIMEQL